MVYFNNSHFLVKWWFKHLNLLIYCRFWISTPNQPQTQPLTAPPCTLVRSNPSPRPFRNPPTATTNPNHLQAPIPSLLPPNPSYHLTFPNSPTKRSQGRPRTSRRSRPLTRHRFRRLHRDRTFQRRRPALRTWQRPLPGFFRRMWRHRRIFPPSCLPRLRITGLRHPRSRIGRIIRPLEIWFCF